MERVLLVGSERRVRKTMTPGVMKLVTVPEIEKVPSGVSCVKSMLQVRPPWTLRFEPVSVSDREHPGQPGYVVRDLGSLGSNRSVKEAWAPGLLTSCAVSASSPFAGYRCTFGRV